jgi:hypothetical protein
MYQCYLFDKNTKKKIYKKIVKQQFHLLPLIISPLHLPKKKISPPQLLPFLPPSLLVPPSVSLPLLVCLLFSNRFSTHAFLRRGHMSEPQGSAAAVVIITTQPNVVVIVIGQSIIDFQSCKIH